MAMLQFQLLGNFHLIYHGVPVTTIHQARLQSLLAYLALHAQTPLSRRHLAFLFWPDSSEEQARTNLRRQLYELRVALPSAEEYLAIRSQWIQWRPAAPFTVDVSEFEELLTQADALIQGQQVEEALAALEQAVELYQGPFLRGSYEDWVLEKPAPMKRRVVLPLRQSSNCCVRSHSRRKWPN